MESPCEGCDEDSILCRAKKRCTYHKDVVFCESCSSVFDWVRLGDEYIKTRVQPHGEFMGAPAFMDEIVGWVCPECGHMNEM